jgi:hypothetical protein
VLTWAIDFGEAFRRYCSRFSPSEQQITDFYEWCFHLTEVGPPLTAQPVPGDPERFVHLNHSLGLRVQFLVVAHERLILFKDIEPLG